MKDTPQVELKSHSPSERVLQADAAEWLTPSNDDANGSMARADFWAWRARELHDGATQEVWYLQSELASLADRVPENQAELCAEITRLQRIAQDAYQELRATLKWLNSRSIPRVDLTAELVELTLKFSESLGMEVELQPSTEVKKVEVPGKVGREIRRLIQEALWNSWRHSMSTRARVAIQPSNFGLMITVSDDGCGFRLDEVDESHYGLRNMRERAESIQGRLYVSSRSGKGTVVTLHVPQEVLSA